MALAVSGRLSVWEQRIFDPLRVGKVRRSAEPSADTWANHFDAFMLETPVVAVVLLAAPCERQTSESPPMSFSSFDDRCNSGNSHDTRKLRYQRLAAIKQ